MEAGMVTAEELAALRLELELTAPRRRRERPRPWAKAALCAGVPASVFYAADPEPARALCRPCPVRLECLAHAVTFPETWGTWGGLAPDELEELRAILGLEPAPPSAELPPELEPVEAASEEAALGAFRQADAAVARAQAKVRAAGKRRREALLELRALGWSVTTVAEATGLSRGRVQQITAERRAG